MTNSQRISILSIKEEEYLGRLLSRSRKEQIESLKDNVLLDQFLQLMAGSQKIMAFEENDEFISWESGKGFKLHLSENFFKDFAASERAFKAIRKVFFENFVDPETLLQLQSSQADSDLEFTPSGGKEESSYPYDEEANEAILAEQCEEDEELETLEDHDIDSEDLLSKVGALDENTLAGSLDHDEADEFSNLVAPDEIEIDSANLESEELEISTSDDSNREEEKAESPDLEEIDESADQLLNQTAEENQNLSVQESNSQGGGEDDHISEENDTDQSADDLAEQLLMEAEEMQISDSNSEDTFLTDQDGSEGEPDQDLIDQLLQETGEIDSDAEELANQILQETQLDTDEDVDANALAEEILRQDSSTIESDIDDELEQCIQQLKELEMPDKKINALAEAVRKGKASIETVWETIEKLREN